MKKLTKNLLSIFICLFFIFILFSCGNKRDNQNPETPVDPNIQEESSILRVGVAAPNIGSFLPNNLTGGDNISTTKKIIFGYSLITYTKNEKYEVDKTVVKDFAIERIEGVGTKYIVKLAEDLKWSNGDNLTAKDYVGSILLFRNALYYEATNQRAFLNDSLLGTQEYYSDTSGLGELIGVNLINDYEFSYIITKEWKYTSLSDVSVTPCPMDVLLPGVIIEQGEKGTKFSGKTTDEIKTIIYNTVINDGKGYKWYPSVTCGPYKVESLDNEIWSFTKNEYYKGNYEGQTPKIDKIIFECGIDDLSLLNKGELDLTDYGFTDEWIKDINSDLVEITSYDETQLNLAFHSDKGITRFKEVRQAIAYLTKNKTYYGDYSLDQWMTKESLDENGNILGINSDREYTPLNKYEFNVEKAIELIEQAGYIYGDVECTNKFIEGDKLRYRKNDDGTVEPLVLEVVTTDQYKYILNELIEQAEKIGFNIIVINGDFQYIYDYFYAFKGNGYENIPDDASYEEVMASYNKEKDNRIGNAYIYPVAYDANLQDASYYTGLDDWENGNNIFYLYVEELDKAARSLDNAQTIEEYLEAWQSYQYYFNENLPMITLQSTKTNIVYSNKIVGLKDNLTYNWRWTSQILYCEKVE